MSRPPAAAGIVAALPGLRILPRAALAVAAAAALLLTVAGCDLDKREGVLMAAGSYKDVAVLISSESLRPAIRPFIDRLNRPFHFVIAQELPYEVDIYGPSKWKLGQGYKNVIFLIDWSDHGAVVKAASGLLSEENRALVTRGGIAMLEDPFSRYQLGLVVGGPDRNSLASVLARSEPEIARILQERTLARIRDRFRHEGIRTQLAERYRARFGFTIEIPNVYKENQVLPDFPAVEWMRTGPSRGITLAWRPAEDPQALLADHEALLELRQRLGRVVHDEDLVPESLTWTEAELAGLPAVKLEGAWAGKEFSGGGPFWTYFLADKPSGRLWCLDLLTYAPGKDKLPFFREMLAVASTFSPAASAAR